MEKGNNIYGVCGGGSTCGGIAWFIGWLFTLGFLSLSFWKGALALIVWPYYLGEFISTLIN